MWQPASEGEIHRALAVNDARESHTLEFKQEVGQQRGERTETARDLASLAIDGGVLIIGIAEDKQAHGYSLAPQALPGLIESLESVAEQRIDPPLSIRAVEVPSAADPTCGYVVVTVHPSPSAPHMVDGIYYGRGEMRRQRLSDAEVIRYHALRRTVGELADAALDLLIDADPITAGRNGHLYLVAVPVTGSPALAEEFAWNRDQVREVLGVADDRLPDQLRDGSLTLSQASWPQRKERGYILSTIDRRRADPAIDETYTIEFGVTEDGVVTLFTGGLTQPWHRKAESPEEHLLLDGQLVATCYQFLTCLIAVADRLGYTGPWDIGIAGSGMRDAMSAAIEGTDQWKLPLDKVAYPADQFRERARATRLELDDDLAAVVRRLVARVLRGVGSYDALKDHLT